MAVVDAANGDKGTGRAKEGAPYLQQTPPIHSLLCQQGILLKPPGLMPVTSDRSPGPGPCCWPITLPSSTLTSPADKPRVLHYSNAALLEGRPLPRPHSSPHSSLL